MLVVETIARIRREFFVKGRSIKEIVRDLKVSRNTVRKVLRSGETSFSYEREVQPLPRLGRWRADLDRLLADNEGKAARERLTLIRVFEELRGLGYEGGYDAVRRYARSWRKARVVTSVDAFVPLTFEPGEAYQFDWSHEIVLINGTTVTVKVAHLRLCHSRMLFVRAYPRETQEMVFDAHDRAFARAKPAAAAKAASPTTLPGWTSSSSTSSAICRSPNPVASSCSTSSAVSTSRPRSSSRPTSPSANGRPCSATPR